MFVLVNKENYLDYQDCLIEIENTYYHKDWPKKERAIQGSSTEFLLYNHKDHGVVGGARINKIDKNHIISKHFIHNGYILPDLAVVEEVFFHLSGGSHIHESGDLFNELCAEFYTGLYNALMLHQFIYQKALITANYIDDHEDIKHFGEWHFSIEHRLPGTDENSDLIMGIIGIEA